MTEVRHKCPLCRGELAAEGLREGVLPTEARAIKQEGAVQDQMPQDGEGPLIRPNPVVQDIVMFESKLNALLAEVLPAALCRIQHIRMNVPKLVCMGCITSLFGQHRLGLAPHTDVLKTHRQLGYNLALSAAVWAG